MLKLLKKNKIKMLLALVGGLLVFAPSVFAKDLNFYVDSSYDLHGRKEIQATMVLETDNLYFYVDKELWDFLPQQKKNLAYSNFSNLAIEFNGTIYPVLTSTFGSEPRPGIDGDEKITLLFHPLKGNAQGYFNNGNQYSKKQYIYSNEKEMIYFNSNYLENPGVKNLLAHEFTHLITFNQKELLRDTIEDVWLNEARAEYAPTLVGYDKNYQGSNLQKRVFEFLRNHKGSLISWSNVSADYGMVNLFVQYLVDQYGIDILVDSLQSDKNGVEGINEALKKNGYKEDFGQVFTDWTVAVLLNDCSVGERYCFKNDILKNFSIFPENYTIPEIINNITLGGHVENFSARWQAFSSNKEVGDLVIKFEGVAGLNIRIPYVLCLVNEKCAVNFFDLGEKQAGEIILPTFDFNNSSLRVILVALDDSPGKEGVKQFQPFSFEASLGQGQNNNIASSNEVNNLLSKIGYLKAEIAKMQKVDAGQVLSETKKNFSCNSIQGELYFGLMNNKEVMCLQEFLLDQGIYPEGLITGNFLGLTKEAVIRFQKKYKPEILEPLGLNNGTGYFGQNTKAKVNQLLNF